MQDIGTQYPKDDLSDPSGFLSKARYYQSNYRAETLDLPFDEFGNYLMQEDGEKGHNFYNDLGIFDAVKYYRKYNKQLYSNMLRSEHIPFNFFIPFRHDLNFCKSVFNEIMGGCIKSIDSYALIDNKENLKIEFAPRPIKDYLKDRTSFDTYIEYTHNDGAKGILGIEVKYTERGYHISGKHEEYAIEKEDSPYHTTTKQCGLYKPEAIEKLKADEFRQIWRNQLLGEKIILNKPNEFKHFTSLTFFPKGNSHFIKASEKYIEMLQNNQNHFIPVKYEDFFTYLTKHSPDCRYSKWIDYLKERYIVK